jgi:hypothetical protein
MVNVPVECAYLHTALPRPEPFTLDASDQDSQNDTEFDPPMLTADGTVTGCYTIC